MNSSLPTAVLLSTLHLFLPFCGQVGRKVQSVFSMPTEATSIASISSPVAAHMRAGNWASKALGMSNRDKSLRSSPGVFLHCIEHMYDLLPHLLGSGARVGIKLHHRCLCHPRQGADGASPALRAASLGKNTT